MGAVASDSLILQRDSGRADAAAIQLPPPFAGRIAEMPTQLPAREPTKTQLLIQCGRYIAGIAVLLVAVVLFQLRLVRASHATARLGERIGGGSPVFS
jgi:hypothetical protein